MIDPELTSRLEAALRITFAIHCERAVFATRHTDPWRQTPRQLALQCPARRVWSVLVADDDDRVYRWGGRR